MTHSDPDVLAMMATGDPDVPAVDVEHVAQCDDCARDLRAFRRIVDIARSGSPADSLDTPAPSVWEGIAATLGLGAGTAGSSLPAPSPAGRAPGTDATTAAGAHGSVPSAIPIGSGRRGRRTGWRWLAGAAAAAIVIAIVIALVVPRNTATLLAEARLDALPEWRGASGSAILEQRPDGERDIVVTLDLEASDLPSRSGYREVWLLSEDLSRLISLGTMASGEHVFALPAEVDLADFPIVDVSLEPVDGDPLHSGDSIVRGTLAS